MLQMWMEWLWRKPLLHRNDVLCFYTCQTMGSFEEMILFPQIIFETYYFKIFNKKEDLSNLFLFDS